MLLSSLIKPSLTWWITYLALEQGKSFLHMTCKVVTAGQSLSHQIIPTTLNLPIARSSSQGAVIQYHNTTAATIRGAKEDQLIQKKKFYTVSIDLHFRVLGCPHPQSGQFSGRLPKPSTSRFWKVVSAHRDLSKYQPKEILQVIHRNKQIRSQDQGSLISLSESISPGLLVSLGISASNICFPVLRGHHLVVSSHVLSGGCSIRW